MKLKSYLIRLITAGLLCSSLSAIAAPDPNFHIYLMFGQSNMEGMGTVAAQDRTTNPRVKVLQDQTCSNLNRTYGTWYLASPPLNRCWSGIGPGDYFGKTMAEGMPSSITIGLVPASVAGSDIALYQKSAPIGRAGADIPVQFSGGYAWLLDLAKKAQQAGVIKGIIFHQGETNTGDANWKYKVQEIVNNLRTDLGIGNVPFLAGELLYADYGSCCSRHNVEVNKLPSLITNSYVVSASGLAGVDGAHFSTASYREFGKRYAQLMLTKVSVYPGSSSRASNSSRSSSSSTASGSQCNWYGTIFSICANTASGWGWENNASCVARRDCSALPSPYGVVVTVAAPTQCNWNTNIFPLCKNSNSGWGWENNASCVGINDCRTLQSPYGPF